MIFRQEEDALIAQDCIPSEGIACSSLPSYVAKEVHYLGTRAFLELL